MRLGGDPTSTVHANVLQMRNDYARHEAFASIFTLGISQKEDFSVPEIALVGAQRR